MEDTWGLLRLSTVRSRGWRGFSAGHLRLASAMCHISSGTSTTGTETLALFTLSQEVWIDIISFEFKKQLRSWEWRNSFVVWIKEIHMMRSLILKCQLPANKKGGKQSHPRLSYCVCWIPFQRQIMPSRIRNYTRYTIFRFRAKFKILLLHNPVSFSLVTNLPSHLEMTEVTSKIMTSLKRYHPLVSENISNYK